MRGLVIFPAFLVGLVAGEAIPIVGYLVATNYPGVGDIDGGGAMSMIFLAGPPVALLAGIVAAVVAALWTRKRDG
jgi:MFS family permease